MFIEKGLTFKQHIVKYLKSKNIDIEEEDFEVENVRNIDGSADPALDDNKFILDKSTKDKKVFQVDASQYNKYVKPNTIVKIKSTDNSKRFIGEIDIKYHRATPKNAIRLKIIKDQLENIEKYEKKGIKTSRGDEIYLIYNKPITDTAECKKDLSNKIYRAFKEHFFNIDQYKKDGGSDPVNKDDMISNMTHTATETTDYWTINITPIEPKEGHDHNVFYNAKFNMPVILYHDRFVAYPKDPKLAYQPVSQKLGNRITKIGIDKDYSNEHIYTVITTFRENSSDRTVEMESEPVKFGHVPSEAEYNRIIPYIAANANVRWNYAFTENGQWECPDKYYISQLGFTLQDQKNLPMYMETQFVYFVFAKIGNIDHPYAETAGENRGINDAGRVFVDGEMIYLDHPITEAEKKSITAAVDNNKAVVFDYKNFKKFTGYKRPYSIKLVDTEQLERARNSNGQEQYVGNLFVYRNKYEITNNTTHEKKIVYSEPFTFDQLPTNVNLAKGNIAYGEYIFGEVTNEGELQVDYRGVKQYAVNDITRNNQLYTRNKQILRVNEANGVDISSKYVYQVVYYYNNKPMGAQRNNPDLYTKGESPLIEFTSKPPAATLTQINNTATLSGAKVVLRSMGGGKEYQIDNTLLNHYGIEVSYFRQKQGYSSSQYVYFGYFSVWYVKDRKRIYLKHTVTPLYRSPRGVQYPLDANALKGLTCILQNINGDIKLANDASKVVLHVNTLGKMWDKNNEKILTYDQQVFKPLPIPE